MYVLGKREVKFLFVIYNLSGKILERVYMSLIIKI